MKPLIEMTIATPALVVPAITILILTYSNRFTTLSNRIREFVRKEGQVNNQIQVFYDRIGYVQKMLFFGVCGLAMSVISMFSVMLTLNGIAYYTMAVSLVMIFISLVNALFDISLSTAALKIELEDKC
jgi:hypothetical protein